jgi:NADPH:quinone reductase-like Zn-dependent oxidoreductase
MKAIVYSKYGTADVLEYRDVEKPSPKEDEVLIKIRAGSLNYYDWHFMSGLPLPFRFVTGLFGHPPAILGADMAGTVEEVGANITRFKPGDEVYGDIHKNAFAEYACAPEATLAIKPVSLSFEKAAAVPMAGLTALQGLRDAGQIKPGNTVMIHGASGGVGTFAIQLAKYYGAQVTAVCSTKNVEQALTLGADRVIDYRKEDITRQGDRYDLIFAANGDRSIFEYKKLLQPHGIFVMAGGTNKQLFQAVALGPMLSSKDGRKLGSMVARMDLHDMELLTELLESGKLKPVIDRRYPLSQTADAMRYLAEGHAHGKIVLSVTQ